jgi:hypothetical protein
MTVTLIVSVEGIYLTMEEANVANRNFPGLAVRWPIAEKRLNRQI